MILPILYIMETAHRGRGVFSTESIPAGTTIEIAPVIVLNPSERAVVDSTLLHDYIFEWFEHKTIQIQTIREVAVDEELCINYNGDGVTDKPVWFETK